MSEESGFKILVTNQSNNDRIIRAVIAVVLILAYLAIPSSVNNSIALVGLELLVFFCSTQPLVIATFTERLESILVRYQKPKNKISSPIKG